MVLETRFEQKYSLCTETVRPDLKYKYNLDIYGLR